MKELNDRIAQLEADRAQLLEAVNAGKTALECVIMLSTELNKKSKADLAEYVLYLERVIAKVSA